MASPAPKSPELSDKSKKYDRQIRLWGEHGQSSLEKSSVCLVGATGVGTEVLKSLVLPGIGSFTILDNKKVSSDDLESNFFLDLESMGKSRAEATTQFLVEMNPDVHGDYVDDDVDIVLRTNPHFFTNFTVVIATELSESSLVQLASLLWQNGIPLVHCKSYGFLGYIRVQVRDHTVIESHPDNEQPDLRLDRPFPALIAHCDVIDLDAMTLKDHGHVPYLVILYNALRKWQQATGQALPSNWKEKEALRSLRESDSLLISELSRNNAQLLEQEYDFIVVGGGTAGATVAARLSEVAEWQVLLLEAGGPHQFYMDIPVLVGGLQNGALDWQYLTEPSNHYCRGYANHQCPVPRGKVLGGSSVLNYMLATRGNPKDYDNWRDLGNEGWGWSDVLPYFIKAENMTIPDLRRDPLHGTDGPLSISRSKYRTKLAKAFIQAGRELGHKVGDYNGVTQNQFSYFQFTKKSGRRSSTSRAYLYPVLEDRPNLQVVTSAFVRRLVMDGSKVAGVEVEYDNHFHFVKTRKEVILSGGVINSPQLLMLSGIGPADQLKKFGINQVADLPVGQNLQDHVSFAGMFFLTNLEDNELIATKIADDPNNLADYFQRGFGPYEVPGGNEGVFFYDIANPNADDGFPDVEIHFSTVSPIPEQIVRGFSKNVYDSVFKPYENNISWAIQPILMHPKSRGFIELASADPHDKVKITPNYLEDPADVATILKGIEKIMQIAETEAFKQYGSVLNPLNVPGCEGFELRSEAHWNCLMRVLTITNYHQVGTCAMRPDGVVDNHLRVLGVEGVRVVDASVMPLVPAAHTNIPTNMIAERAVDLIKEIIRGMRLRNEDGVPENEENFEEAIKAVNGCVARTSVPAAITAIFEKAASFDPTSKSAGFWVMVKALEQYVKNEGEGALPLTGTIPDMTAETTRYVQLQQLYREEARRACEDIYRRVQDILTQQNLPAETVTEADVRLLCRHARYLASTNSTTIQEEYQGKNSNLHNLVSEIDPPGSLFLYYVLLRGVDRYRTEFNCYPGQLNDDVEPDIMRLKGCISKLLVEWGWPPLAKDDYLHEICRYGGSQLHSVSAFIGGCAAQEVIKIITNQFKPVDNTFIYDAMTCTTATFAL